VALQKVVIEIVALEKSIRALHMEIASIRSDINDTERLDRTIAEHRVAIAKHEQQIAVIEQRRTCGYEMIAGIQSQLKTLRRKHTNLKSGASIEKLLALVEQMRLLSGEAEVDLDKVEAILSQEVEA
jgi:hypothetical protein